MNKSLYWNQIVQNLFILSIKTLSYKNYINMMSFIKLSKT